MANVRITKSFTFETAHALHGYDGKCRNVHGHSYKLYVTLLGKPIADANHTKFGMVMDFGDLKAIVNNEVVDPMDHAILLNGNSPHRSLGEKLLEEGHKVVFTNYQPSCENMMLDFVEKLKNNLPSEVQLIALRLQETQTAYTEWFASDNP